VTGLSLCYRAGVSRQEQGIRSRHHAQTQTGFGASNEYWGWGERSEREAKDSYLASAWV
jgi:hypothetical protein